MGIYEFMCSLNEKVIGKFAWLNVILFSPGSTTPDFKQDWGRCKWYVYIHGITHVGLHRPTYKSIKNRNHSEKIINIYINIYKHAHNQNHMHTNTRMHVSIHAYIHTYTHGHRRSRGEQPGHVPANNWETPMMSPVIATPSPNPLGAPNIFEKSPPVVKGSTVSIRAYLWHPSVCTCAFKLFNRPQ